MQRKPDHAAKTHPSRRDLSLGRRARLGAVALSPFKRDEKKLTPDELKAQQEREKNYKAAMDKIPDKKVTVDPWGDIRPAPQATAKNKQ